MDLLRKLYNSRCSPPGLGEEERFHFLIKGEEGIKPLLIPVHPFIIREKTKMDLEEQGAGGSGRLIQVPVGVGKGVVEEFVKFLYMEQLDKDVGIKEELQLLRLAMLKELKLKWEYQGTLVEMIDAKKIVDSNGQLNHDQCHRGGQDIPEQEEEEGNLGDVDVADQGNGGFQNGGDEHDDNNDDDGEVAVIGVIKREREPSPVPSSNSRTSARTRSKVSASVAGTYQRQRVCKPRCRRCRQTFSSIIALEGHVKGFHKENPGDPLHSSNPGRQNPRKSRPSSTLKENRTSGDVESVHEENMENPDVSTSTMNQKGKGQRKKSNKNPSTCPSLSNLPSTSGRSVVRLKCFFCSEIFRNHGLLEVHIRNHTKERPYRCQKCNKSFSGQQPLSLHEASSHPNLRCEKCRKTFSTKDSLLIHFRKSHGIYGCGQCDQFFNSKEQMDDHVVRVHERKMYKCQLCTKSYTTNLILKYHVNSVHKKLRYPCPHCDVSYAWPTRLVEHMKRHGGK